jgi:hypothetical protein
LIERNLRCPLRQRGDPRQQQRLALRRCAQRLRHVLHGVQIRHQHHRAAQIRKFRVMPGDDVARGGVNKSCR